MENKDTIIVNKNKSDKYFIKKLGVKIESEKFKYWER